MAIERDGLIRTVEDNVVAIESLTNKTSIVENKYTSKYICNVTISKDNWTVDNTDIINTVTSIISNSSVYDSLKVSDMTITPESSNASIISGISNTSYGLYVGNILLEECTITTSIDTTVEPNIVTTTIVTKYRVKDTNEILTNDIVMDLIIHI